MAMPARVVAQRGAAGQELKAQARFMVHDVVQVHGGRFVGIEVGAGVDVEHLVKQGVAGGGRCRCGRGRVKLDGHGARLGGRNGQGQCQHIQGEQQDQEDDESSSHTLAIKMTVSV